MFLKNKNIKITVSELSLYFSCPRKVYYSCRDHKVVSSSSISYIEHLVLKEMAIYYPQMLKDSSSKDDVSLDELGELLSQMVESIFLIYPDELAEIKKDVMVDVYESLKENLGKICQNLSEQLKVPELVQLAENICVSDTETYLHSQKLNVTGIPYRLVNIGDSFVPLIIKTGNNPENGVWLNDRLHLTSFALLAEEIHDTPVRSGFVLYARSGIFRKVNIRSHDRRQVLKAIGRVRKIKSGTMPDKKESPLCASCDFSDICNVQSSLVSKFF